MKRTLLPAALALLLAGSIAVAQQPQAAPAPDAQQPAAAPAHHHHHHAPNPQRETKKLSKRLHLSADQRAKVEPILADRDQKLTALQADSTLAPQDMHQQMKAIHEATEQQLATVLTPDQLQQWKSMHHGHRGHDQEQPAPPTT